MFFLLSGTGEEGPRLLGHAAAGGVSASGAPLDASSLDAATGAVGGARQRAGEPADQDGEARGSRGEGVSRGRRRLGVQQEAALGAGDLLPAS